MNVALWIIQIILVGMFGMAGFLKTFQTVKAHEMLPWVKNRSDAFVQFVGVSELLGALGMIFPLLTGVLPWLTPLAVVGPANDPGVGIIYRAFAQEGIQDPPNERGPSSTFARCRLWLLGHPFSQLNKSNPAK